MKVSIEREECIACENCVDTCPEVFRMAADGLAEVYGEVTEANKLQVEEAMDSCPVSIITLEG